MKFENYAARTRETLSRNQEIAQTILEQFGGQRLAVMTGAHQFVAIENGLQFQLKDGAKDGIQKVRVILQPSDTYTVQFFKRTADPVNPFALLAEVDDVYCDGLQDVFENHTGLFTTLLARQ